MLQAPSDTAEIPAPRWQGLAPVYDTQARWLLLGSFPGVASLKAQQYYSHPRNQFWALLGHVLAVDLLSQDYPVRLNMLCQRRVAVWDVIAETARQGSLDSAIRAPEASDLKSLLAQLPALHTIAFNGGTAARIGARALGGDSERYRILTLPSSSPAYTMPFDQKLQAWQRLQEE